MNCELPQSLREVITITDDEHVESIPSLTYIKDKLATERYLSYHLMAVVNTLIDVRDISTQKYQTV
ncbi:hypothetical protein UM594_00690 [Staphylococcus aureus]|nr:hypothetical protein UM594_00690 [Staphylococcus aureus]